MSTRLDRPTPVVVEGRLEGPQEGPPREEAAGQEPSPPRGEPPTTESSRKPVQAPSVTSSIDYAVDGLVYAIRHERNLKIHFVLALIAMLASLVIDLGVVQLLLVLMSITMVIVAELFNTAVEAMVNLFTVRNHPLAKIAKDVAAAGVLMASIYALVVGYLILLPGLQNAAALAGPTVLENVQRHPVHALVLALALILVAVAVTKALGERGTYTRGGLMSGHAALAFGAATGIILITRAPLVAVLALLISALVAQARVEAGIHRWSEVLLGAVAGVGLSLLVFYTFGVVIP